MIMEKITLEKKDDIFYLHLLFNRAAMTLQFTEEQFEEFLKEVNRLSLAKEK